VIGFLLAAALAVLFLLGASRGADPVRVDALRRELADVRARVEGFASSDIRDRLEKIRGAVEDYAIGVERLSDRVVRRKCGIADPPQILPAGNHRWRTGLRATLRQQARTQWSTRSAELELPDDRKDALIEVTVMAGSYREYVTERIRKRVLTEETGNEKIDKIDEWERSATEKLLGRKAE